MDYTPVFSVLHQDKTIATMPVIAGDIPRVGDTLIIRQYENESTTFSVIEVIRNYGRVLTRRGPETHTGEGIDVIVEEKNDSGIELC